MNTPRIHQLSKTSTLLSHYLAAVRTKARQQQTDPEVIDSRYSQREGIQRGLEAALDSEKLIEIRDELEQRLSELAPDSSAEPQLVLGRLTLLRRFLRNFSQPRTYRESPAPGEESYRYTIARGL